MRTDMAKSPAFQPYKMVCWHHFSDNLVHMLIRKADWLLTQFLTMVTAKETDVVTIELHQMYYTRTLLIERLHHNQPFIKSSSTSRRIQ